ncbi:MAG: hypothetical protein KC731_41870 [Myxococcales bacterium]|nr:hypothetical protein [Myxococcales bacterium]
MIEVDHVSIRLPGVEADVSLVRDALAIVEREAPEVRCHVERLDLHLTLAQDETLSARRLADAILDELGQVR